jgi:hypothetical protein
LSSEIFTNCTVRLDGGGNEQLGRIAEHILSFLAGLDTKKAVYVDLTNGNSLYKSVLSNVAYIIGARHPFILNIDKSRSTEFLEPDDLLAAYVELPDPAMLDSIARAWLTEVRRFADVARDASKTLVISPV